MKLFNTLSRQIETIKPINPPEVTVYTCGPTVYDYPHIGNWFTFFRYDILLRALKAAGFRPKWVMNITDVGHLVSDADEGEDKLAKGAKREGKTAWEIADFYTAYFINTLDKLNISRPDVLPRATEHIPEQIALVEKLTEKGLTYKIADGIYFDTSKLIGYGKLARLDIKHAKPEARINANPKKRNLTDFALWKFSPKEQKRDMEWSSPWGVGFPGWHLECSAMAMKYLGATLDIHGGGIDHIPIHHTNEIAQSEAITGQSFANLWFHANFLLVEGKKIAKSTGGFLTIEDIENNGIALNAFRMLALQAHYKTEANFSWDNLKAANRRLKRWQAVADLRWQVARSVELEEAAMTVALLNNLDTPSLLVIIDDFLDKVEMNDAHPDTRTLQAIDRLLGINLLQEDICAELKTLLGERQKAREKMDFSRSDEIRDKLNAKGIGIRDVKHGHQIWFRL